MNFLVKKPIDEQYQYENTPTFEYKIQKFKSFSMNLSTEKLILGRMDFAYE